MTEITQANVQWKRLGGIVAIQASITLAWVIYSLYLPDLLVQLGFQAQLAKTILIVEHALEVIIEPIFGNLSDSSQGKIGSRFPYITMGIILASMFFIAVPIIAFFVPAINPWRWLLPVMAVLWASAMAIFRSPVMALLGQIIPQPQLPLATGFLTLTQQLIRAFRFSAYNFILSFGPLFTFAIGSFVILGAGTFLRKVMPPMSPQPESQKLDSISTKTLTVILTTGVFIGLSLRFVFGSLGQIFATELGKDQVTVGMLAFSLLLAFTALPAGSLASKIGNNRTMFIGLISTAALLGVISFTSSNVVFAIALILMSFTFSTVLNGMIPFVLQLIPQPRAGLALGTFFGGFGGAISFFDFFFTSIKTLELKIILGIASLIIVSVFVALNPRNLFGAKQHS